MNRLSDFRLNTRDRKLLGVCSGIGNLLRIDPTFVRIAWVAIPLLTFVTITQALLAYFVCGVIGAVAASKSNRRRDYERMEDSPRGSSVKDLRERLDQTDRRLMAIDHHLNDSSSADLAREIEALRSEKA
ncbi:hypothetical protein GCM10022280_08560 [Sphingomonas swuensis]|uniref:Phage shock protein PspC N-terminal domain-containing protein n=1 Tax=Sphingomonas swuensis TaxID=977800 RepID=A0ABP7SJZ1_9SPHN